MTEPGDTVTDADRGIMIDAPDTDDRDDAIWVRHAESGYDAWVHIALVAAHLAPGGPADTEARRRMHSRYLPDRTIGMLPGPVERAATLAPGRAGDTVTVAMRFSPDADLVDTDITAGRLKQATAISYATASATLDDPAAPHHDVLRTAHALAATLLRRRQNSGALALYDLFKGYATNEEGQLIRLGDNQRNAGYIIVQELMIAANAAIAQWCAERDLPILFRNHRAATVGGSRDDLRAELDAARALGDATGYETLRKRLGFVQRPATYEPAVFGHYGLNLPAYAHTTSPLRRYPDLVNQRILTAAVAGRPSPYDHDTLETLGAELNEGLRAERERRAERHKQAARKAVREQLHEAEFAALEPQQFTKVLHLALRADDPPAALAAEARRRYTTDVLPLRDACEILVSARTPPWRRLREHIYRDLAAEPGKALTVVNMYAQSVLGGPVGDSHLVWRQETVGTAHHPAFAAQLRLELGEVRHTSPRRVQSAKKDAKAQAALGLVAQLAGLDDKSADIDTPRIPPARPGTREPVPADRNPVMAVNEYAQTGVITPPAWHYERTGPPHEPTHTCTVTAMTNGTAAPLTATGTGTGKQAAKTAAAAQLRRLIETAFATTEVPQP